MAKINEQPRAAKIGRPQRIIEVEPLSVPKREEEPLTVPERETERPIPEPERKEPAKEPEKEPIPARLRIDHTSIQTYRWKVPA